MQLTPDQQIGRYAVIDTLGHGGMSDVYRARDTQEDRDVVLKFPHEDMMGDVATYERFTREVKIGQLLSHPHIQRLYELAEIGSAQFLVLEYVPGQTLRQVLHERSGHPTPEDFADAVGLGRQIADALAYAHGHHVAHRDMKPENIIVTADGQAKVMDFGIAFVKGARRVTWGPLSSQVGTPDYMAPEQIQGQRGDSRTDVYALGMILYEYVTGRLPYQGDNALSIMNQHVTVKPPPPHRFRPDVPPALEEAIMKAIRRRPEDRWPTMEAFHDALQHLDQVAVAALKAERESEPGDSPAAGRLASRLGLHAGSGSLAVAVAILVMIGLLLFALHVFSPGRAHH